MIISEKKLRKIISEIVAEEIYQEGFLDRAYRILGPGAAEIGKKLSQLVTGEDGGSGGGSGGPAPYKGGSPSSWTVEGSHAARAVELSKATGVDPAFIYAVERKE